MTVTGFRTVVFRAGRSLLIRYIEDPGPQVYRVCIRDIEENWLGSRAESLRQKDGSLIDGTQHTAENRKLTRRSTDITHLIRRFAFPLLLTIATLLAVVAMWQALTANDSRRTARIIEAES
jgi:hypothetical protein